MGTVSGLGQTASQRTELASTSILSTGKKKKTTASAKLLTYKVEVCGLANRYTETTGTLLALRICTRLPKVVVAVGFEGRGDCMQQQEQGRD